MFTMHALEIKSYSSERQEGREFKKKKTQLDDNLDKQWECILLIFEGLALC